MYVCVPVYVCVCVHMHVHMGVYKALRIALAVVPQESCALSFEPVSLNCLELIKQVRLAAWLVSLKNSFVSIQEWGYKGMSPCLAFCVKNLEEQKQVSTFAKQVLLMEFFP